MARCTAPVEGHRSASAAAACPACRGRGRYSSYSSYGSHSSPSYSPSGSSGGGRSSIGGAGSSGKAKLVASRFIPVVHACRSAGTHAKSAAASRNRAALPDLRDVFLCHVWDDRQRAAKQLHNLLKSLGVSFWFSEKDVGLGTPLLRAMDKGLAKSRVGIVLVTLRCCAASQRRASPTKSFRLS